MSRFFGIKKIFKKELNIFWNILKTVAKWFTISSQINYLEREETK